MEEITQKDRKEFIIEHCKLYNVVFTSFQNYFLGFYSNDKNERELIDFLQAGNKIFDIERISSDKDSGCYSIKGFPLTITVPKDERRQQLAKDLSRVTFTNSFYLIIDNENQFYIDFDNQNFDSDESKQLLGIFLLCTNEMKDCFDSNEQIEIIRIDDFIQGLNLYNFIYGPKQQEQDNNQEQNIIGEEEEDNENEDNKINKKNILQNYEEAEEEGPRIGRKRKRNVLSDQQVRDDTMVFLSKLQECVELDQQSQQKQRPALEKLKYISKIEKFLANYLYQKAFLNENGLEILQEWVKKNQDGTYPALNQLNKILDILLRINSITLTHLKNSQIGGYVMELSKNMKYSKNIQRKASDLIQKWSRIVYSINIDYSDIETENLKYKEIFQSNNKKDYDEEDEDDDIETRKEEEKEIAQDRAKELEIYNHAKIPKRGLFDFIKKPKSNIDESKIDESKKFRYNVFDKNKKGPGRKKND